MKRVRPAPERSEAEYPTWGRRQLLSRGLQGAGALLLLHAGLGAARAEPAPLDEDAGDAGDPGGDAGELAYEDDPYMGVAGCTVKLSAEPSPGATLAPAAALVALRCLKGRRGG